jgi:hypothetical protein
MKWPSVMQYSTLNGSHETCVVEVIEGTMVGIEVGGNDVYVIVIFVVTTTGGVSLTLGAAQETNSKLSRMLNNRFIRRALESASLLACRGAA